MRQLVLNLGERSYNIYINEGLISEVGRIESYCEGNNVLILTNETISPLYADKLKNAFRSKNVHLLELPDGERFKNLQSYSTVLDYLIEQGFRRNDTLLALGGGVIGDLGGFVAASYQRGMGFIQVPTTLLAQVDSSVGGKTAVNHPQGKNMIGAFYQPKAVFIDTSTLDTLPDKEFISGLAEVAKYAMLGSKEIEAILEINAEKLLARDKSLLADIIFYSCEKKADVVAADEEEKGSRALLNLGHTFGHAIERISEYKYYLHGEAVAIGTLMAVNLAVAKKLLNEAVAERYLSMIQSLKLPVVAEYKMTVEQILDAMKLDKKNVNDKYRLVLPVDSGCVIVEEDNLELMRQAIDRQLE